MFDHDDDNDQIIMTHTQLVLSCLNVSWGQGTPLPVLPLPLPFLIPSFHSNASMLQPFSHSPTSSVFSIPTITCPSSSTQTITLLTYLHPRSHSSSGLGTLPPSPLIHHKCERRCLRKKSCPPGSWWEHHQDGHSFMVEEHRRVREGKGHFCWLRRG